MPSKKPKKKLFDGIAKDHALDELLGKKRAKKSRTLAHNPEPYRRYRKYTQSDKLWILEMLEKLPRGYGDTFLRRLNITRSLVYYWRKSFIERQTVLPPEPVVELQPAKDTSHAKDHEFGISDSFRRELDEDYDK